MTSSVRLDELVLLTVALLLVAAGVLAFCKRLRLPFTVTLVLVGLLLRHLAMVGPDWLAPLASIEISPELILFVFLPTLIFESAFNLDWRQLRHNLLPVLTLAIPGLLLSTAVIGGLLAWATPIELAPALLLGAILSATDPVAVIALFKQLGAPKRLTVLVEGESLFNDATALVLAKILLLSIAAGAFGWQGALEGAGEFVRVFFGGVAIGWLLAVVVAWVLGQVESDPYIEISLTTILAYLSFLVAEHFLHVSGVMATVAAGITLGGWGRTKISTSVADYLEHFWEYMAYVANALIFLLVGLTVHLETLVSSLHLLPWVILAMLVSRAAVIYGLVPLAGALSEPVSRAYQTVMFWGGLRGAIALAIVLSLDELEYAPLFTALVTGAVLFTLLAQGLSIERLVRRLGLDRPPLGDRLARSEGLLAAKQRALSLIPRLQRGGLFSQRVAHQLTANGEQESALLRSDLQRLRGSELPPSEEKHLLLVRCLAEERTYYRQLFSEGHLPEQAYRDLGHSVDQQMDAVRQQRPMPAYTLHPPGGDLQRRWLLPLLDQLPFLSGLTQRLRVGLIARDYEEAWGRHQGSGKLLLRLEQIAREQYLSAPVVNEVSSHYRAWQEAARVRLDDTANQFPEFVEAMQARLGGRLLAHAEEEVIRNEVRAGTLPPGQAAELMGDLRSQVRRLRRSDLASLEIPPQELLRKVPFFQDTPESEFAHVAEMLRKRMVSSGENIIQQGERGDSLFLVLRGVVRVSVTEDGAPRDLATLIAGDFFGEMALLHGEPRSATCRAVTPCALFELRREDFDEATASCPAMRQALEEADHRRKRGLQN